MQPDETSTFRGPQRTPKRMSWIRRCGLKDLQLYNRTLILVEYIHLTMATILHKLTLHKKNEASAFL